VDRLQEEADAFVEHQRNIKNIQKDGQAAIEEGLSNLNFRQAFEAQAALAKSLEDERLVETDKRADRAKAGQRALDDLNLSFEREREQRAQNLERQLDDAAKNSARARADAKRNFAQQRVDARKAAQEQLKDLQERFNAENKSYAQTAKFGTDALAQIAKFAATVKNGVAGNVKDLQSLIKNVSSKSVTNNVSNSGGNTINNTINGGIPEEIVDIINQAIGG
jgi:myosin heavy subunit